MAVLKLVVRVWDLAVLGTQDLQPQGRGIGFEPGLGEASPFRVGGPGQCPPWAVLGAQEAGRGSQSMGWHGSH